MLKAREKYPLAGRGQILVNFAETKKRKTNLDNFRFFLVICNIEVLSFVEMVLYNLTSYDY